MNRSDKLKISLISRRLFMSMCVLSLISGCAKVENNNEIKNQTVENAKKIYQLTDSIVFLDAYKDVLGAKPQKGLVQNAESAVKIVEIILTDVYGDIIYKQQPYAVLEKDSVWHIEGTLHDADVGGVF